MVKAFHDSSIDSLGSEVRIGSKASLSHGVKFAMSVFSVVSMKSESSISLNRGVSDSSFPEGP